MTEEEAAFVHLIEESLPPGSGNHSVFTRSLAYKCLNMSNVGCTIGHGVHPFKSGLWLSVVFSFVLAPERLSSGSPRV
jgi:hypothetical protein